MDLWGTYQNLTLQGWEGGWGVVRAKDGRINHRPGKKGEASKPGSGKMGKGRSLGGGEDTFEMVE